MKQSHILPLSILVLCLFLFNGPVAAADERSPWPDLRASGDEALQVGLERAIQSLGLSGPAGAGQLAVALVDITDPRAPRMGAVNGDTMLYAASLPKIAILLGAFDRIACGALPADADTMEKITRMIRNSSNHCATEILNRVGKPYLAKLLQSARYKLYDPAHKGGLWVGKDYGRAGAWKRDPLAHLSHGATVLQVARFYYLLETGRLVSPEHSRQMKAIMGDPAIPHKFVKGLQVSRPGSKIFRKSGTWRQYHADSAIVERDGRRYIAAALAADAGAGGWFPRLIVAMDDLIHHPEIYMAAGKPSKSR